MPVFLRKCAAVCMAAVLSLVTVGCLDWEEDIPLEEQGNASDTYTLMLYMCASDLESECGFATEDLNEIMYGYTAGNLNVIVQTGGTAEWQNTVVEDDRCQRYRVTEDGLELVDDSLGMQNMADSATLTDFIQYCSSNYAADHYGLVLWDHGGGVVGGYGYDENFGGDSMSLTEMSRALGDASVHLDMLGFDACLMANFETCLMAAPYADYLIASEEPEPGCGWYYTDWIGKLSENCGIPPKRYGRQIIDDYITESGWDSPSMYSTLGMFDLQQVTQKLLPALSQFSDDAVQQLSAGEYRRISQSRSNTRAVYQSELDHIDLLDYAQHSQSETADQLEQAVSDCVVYYRETENGSGDNGLSILFPYYDLSALDMLEEMYQTLGYDDAYPAFLEQFANVMAGGQISVSGFSNTQNHAAASEYSGFQWFDADAGYDESYYETYSADLSLLETTEVDGRCVLELSEEDWEIVNDAAMQMFAVYDGFYVDMGLDDYCEFDDYGNLIVEYDQTWVALDGQVVPFFHESYTSDGDSFFTCGSVPCVYNGTDAEIVLVWDTEHPSGYAAGVRPVYTDSVAAKGLYDICDGDTFQVYYDIYDEDLNYVETMTLDDEIFTVQDSLEVGYADAAEQLGDTFIYYVLEDIYNNTYYTDSIAYLEE
ncbi:MAG: clostripain-related cysteine peptidase [Ruminococcus callidus]|mgnify:FL=1|uniref:clostripain-related cysteine peptidase n=1 Tax=Ruminococcus callidus TaxID=40519 RepID=UPI002E7A37AC|nr:clostripain-related cysteine peptidase [Ruminococcus callidus]MEE0507265.1 clostripain-related cysteine peptidase [Ruminococcus callidus]